MANDFLGRTLRPANRPRASSKLKSSIWLRRSLSSSFSANSDSNAAGGGDHLRAGIPGLGDEAVEAEPGQQGQEEEDARDARAERAAGREVQLSAVRDLGRFRAGRSSAAARPGRPPAAVREKKGGVTPRRQSARKRLAIDFSAEAL